jgi:hypothetical protein
VGFLFFDNCLISAFLIVLMLDGEDPLGTRRTWIFQRSPARSIFLGQSGVPLVIKETDIFKPVDIEAMRSKCDLEFERKSMPTRNEQNNFSSLFNGHLNVCPTPGLHSGMKTEQLRRSTCAILAMQSETR